MESVGGSQRYKRRYAPPKRATSSSSASSIFMLYSPERPTGSTSSLQLGPSAHRPICPSDRRVGFHRRTGAHQVAIAESGIDPADKRPHLVLPGRRRGETGAVARIG